MNEKQLFFFYKTRENLFIKKTNVNTKNRWDDIYKKMIEINKSSLLFYFQDICKYMILF